MIEEKAVDILNQLEALAKQYTPDVIDAAINVTRIEGLSAIIGGFAMLVCIYPAYNAAIRLYRYFTKKQEQDRYADWELCVMSVVVVGPIIVLCLAIFGLANVLDIWRWVAVFEPKLYIAKQIMGM